MYRIACAILLGSICVSASAPQSRGQTRERPSTREREHRDDRNHHHHHHHHRDHYSHTRTGLGLGISLAPSAPAQPIYASAPATTQPRLVSAGGTTYVLGSNAGVTILAAPPLPMPAKEKAPIPPPAKGFTDAKEALQRAQEKSEDALRRARALNPNDPDFDTQAANAEQAIKDGEVELRNAQAALNAGTAAGEIGEEAAKLMQEYLTDPADPAEPKKPNNPSDVKERLENTEKELKSKRAEKQAVDEAKKAAEAKKAEDAKQAEEAKNVPVGGRR